MIMILTELILLFIICAALCVNLSIGLIVLVAAKAVTKQAKEVEKERRKYLDHMIAEEERYDE